jgi:thiol-disulfide isomerase/thioredoxin
MLLASLLTPTFLFAQPQSRALSIGQVCPDVRLQIANSASESATLGQFKGKSIILDFWATWCAPCVFGLSVSDSLQKEFQAKLAIIPVTSESRSVVDAFFEKYKRTKGISPMTVINDTALNEMFPHQTVPHYVWIDATGVVRYFSFSESVTADNIAKFVNGQALSISAPPSIPSTRAGILAGDDITKDSNLISYHILSNFIPGHGGQYGARENWISIYNFSIMGLFCIAYGEGPKYFGGFSRLQLITSDSSRFTDNSGPGLHSVAYRSYWRTIPGHEYSYFLKTPKGDTANKFAIFRRDLQTAFPDITAHIATKRMRSLVLERTDAMPLFEATDTGHYSLEHSPYYLICHHVPMDYFATSLKMLYQGSELPFINEVNYHGNINFSFEGNVSNISELNKALNKVGLRLWEKDADVDIVVIEDHSNKQPDRNGYIEGSRNASR